MTDANDPIPPITRDDEAAGSGDMVAGNIARLKALFPEIVTDGKVDFDVLRELLGDAVDEGEERYGLNWKGKRRARAFALTPSLGTLRPAPEDSVDWDSTKNILVEGDNLEALKILRRSYGGKVKLIFIDPPYNTGNDFVYNDNYKNSIGNYLYLTGQADGEKSLTSEREVGGRLHTEWLNMIYPRLSIAKEFLRSDGAIFISIDEGEIASLRAVMDEVFGQENFVDTVIWQKVFSPKNSAQYFSSDHDYIVVYAKNIDDFSLNLLPRTNEMEARYSNTDDDPRGPWTSGDMTARNYYGLGTYPVQTPSGRTIPGPPPGRYWSVSEDNFKKLDADNRIWWGVSGDNMPRLKRFVSEVKDGKTPQTIWFHGEVGNTQESKKELLADLPFQHSDSVFETPKPTRLIERIMHIAAPLDGDIVMDFFAGSGTTGVAAMKAAFEGSVKRRFLLVQLPERFEKPALLNDGTELSNIAALTGARLRRAGRRFKEKYPGAAIDTGFRVYKLATSNLKPWQPDGERLEASILDSVDNVLPGRTEDDLLVELLLKTGIDLTLPEDRRKVAAKIVYALGGGVLMVCLGNIGADDAEVLGQGMADWVDELDPVQTTVYFKDTGLGADGNRAATKANLAAILRQRLGDRIAKIASI